MELIDSVVTSPEITKVLSDAETKQNQISPDGFSIEAWISGLAIEPNSNANSSSGRPQQSESWLTDKLELWGYDGA